MKILLPKLTEKLKYLYPKTSQIQVPAFVKQLPQEDSPVISHLWFWPRLSYFFKPKDVIVTETGSRFPQSIPFLSYIFLRYFEFWYLRRSLADWSHYGEPNFLGKHRLVCWQVLSFHMY